MGSCDNVVFTGDGVDDLLSLIARLQENAATNFVTNQRFLCDVGTQYSDWRPFDIEDLQAILAQYIIFWGNVDKPNAYAVSQSVALQIPVQSSPV